MKGTILVGTAGQGILRSIDNGATWHRLGLKEAIEFDGTVRSLAVDPRNDQRILAGADAGLCLSWDGGAHFSRVESPMNGKTVWAIAFDPSNPRMVYAGTGAPSRAEMFRSADGGATWTLLPIEIPEFCKGVNRPRILSICVDPTASGEVWFGIEEGGVWRSSDGGDTWTRVDTPASGISNSDIHAVAILPPAEGQPKKIIVLTVNSVFESQDGGVSWTGKASMDRFDDMYYTRTIQPLPGHPEQLLLAIGDGTPGTRTKIYRSADRGETWRDTTIHTPANSTFWAFGVHAADPDLIFAGTKYGQLYKSTDAGKSWFKVWRDFSEITSVAWTPHVAPVTAHPQSTGKEAPKENEHVIA